MTVKELRDAIRGLDPDLNVELYISDLERKGDLSVCNWRGIERVSFQPCEHDDYVLVEAEHDPGIDHKGKRG